MISKGLNASQLKWVAMLAMLVDHLSVTFGSYLYQGTFLEGLIYTPYSAWLRWIGRLAFPIFAFLLAEGARNTRSPARYAGRLAVFALLSQIPYTLAFSNFARIAAPETVPLLVWNTAALNVLFTLLLGLTAILCWQRGNTAKKWWYAGTILVIAFGEWLNCDYGALGVMLIFLLWKFPSPVGRFFSVVSFSFLNYLVSWNSLSIPTAFSPSIVQAWLQRIFPCFVHPSVSYFMPFFMSCFSLVFLHFYNQKRGSLNRWFAYVYYPGHLLVLSALRETAIYTHFFNT